MNIYVVLTLQSADCERGFSAMKRIKTATRNRLSNTTLEQLMYISINGPDLKNFDFQKAVATWYSRGVRRIDLPLTSELEFSSKIQWAQEATASEIMTLREVENRLLRLF
eukprot:Pompholyxophrys_punicea_v1_NODE_844_length_1222_cov_6.458440.p1 type:complete len:110 gc:universal NODE_844_length_1222_cov_6.458440:781-452(-)